MNLDPTTEELTGMAIQTRMAMLGMSRKEIAQQTGYSYGHISSILTGEKGASIKFMEEVLAVLQLTWAGLSQIQNSIVIACSMYRVHHG